MLEKGDVRCVECQAHAIRGASANVGGESMRTVALNMEEAAAAGDIEVARGHMTNLRGAFDRLKNVTGHDGNVSNRKDSVK